MPLTLRRRPRTLPDEPEALEAAPQPVAAEPTQAAAAAQAAQEPVRATVNRTRRRTSATDDWFGRLLGEGFFFLLGLSAWLINAIFTTLGVTTFIGLSPGTFVLGLTIHLGLSRAEVYLWHRWYDPWYLILLLSCVLVDVGTTLLGIVALFAARAPQLLGGAPMNVLQWNTLIISAAMGDPLPVWASNATLVLLLALALALGSERLLRRFWAGLVETWRERYPVST
jgi:hypothetical protein